MHDYSLLFAASTTEAGAWYAYTPTPPAVGTCYEVHGAHNFFMARTDALRRFPWHPKMSIFEHEYSDRGSNLGRAGPLTSCFLCSCML